MWFTFLAGFSVSFVLIILVVFAIPMRARKENEIQRKLDHEFRNSTIIMHNSLMDYWGKATKLMIERNDILSEIKEAYLESIK